MLASSSSEDDESYPDSPLPGKPKFIGGGSGNSGRGYQVPLSATLKQTTLDTSSGAGPGQVFSKNYAGSALPNNAASVDRLHETTTIRGRAGLSGYPDQDGRQTIGGRPSGRYRGLPNQRSLASSEADAGVLPVNGPSGRLPHARANSRTFSASRSSLMSNDSSYRDRGIVSERFYENSPRASCPTVH